jgi:hypothetical protein
VSKPGKPSGLCSAGLLDVCTAQRMWPDYSEFRFLVSRLGKPSGLCRAGPLDVCTAQRRWPDVWVV